MNQATTDKRPGPLGESGRGVSYAALPQPFYASLAPTRFPAVKMFALNETLLRQLGIDVGTTDTLSLLSGGATLHGGDALALAYAGHQFGHYSPLLGDGRARLVGEITNASGQLHDIHLKGAGATPFSRGGDGKATLGSAVREYIVSEAMAALGVPTTRALAIVTTGEMVERNELHPGAVLARTGQSHLRVGTFQYASTLDNPDHLKALADYAIDRLYPELKAQEENIYGAFLRAVGMRQAKLISAWMGFGFIHGVMNTDNSAISGETIDYGPCAYMDSFHPAKVFSSIDRLGRYAWNKQAEIGSWNLARLAEAMLPLLGETEAEQSQAATTALTAYVQTFQSTFTGIMARKLGLDSAQEGYADFLTRTFSVMTENAVDYTAFFTRLTRYANGDLDRLFDDEFSSSDSLEAWSETWMTLRNASDGAGQESPVTMRAVNPVRIARNHRVEKAIERAESGDKHAMLSLLAALEQPFAESAEHSAFEAPPQPEELVHETFCGT